MIKAEYMALAFIAGIVLGIFFFGGLWFTVKQALGSRYSALWFLGSSMVRTALVLIGFYFVAQGSWQMLTISVVGFIAGRFLVIQITKTFERKHISLNKAEQQ
jgi:F1F0 ATPase subunit 2